MKHSFYMEHNKRLSYLLPFAGLTGSSTSNSSHGQEANHFHKNFRW